MPGAAGEKRYRPADDLTLRQDQADAGGFHPGAQGADDFRYDSNKTQLGYKSGYHEAAVTTDNFGFMRKAHKTEGGANTHTLPSTASKRSFFKDHLSVPVSTTVLEHLVELADGFRTDTAQTILSAKGGKAAGHAGSKLRLTRQGEAHDLLRAAVMDIVKTPSGTAGLSKASVATLLGSVTVTSMAPGVVARRLDGGTAQLMGKGPALLGWEKNRNEGKRRVEEQFNRLAADEKQFVRGRSLRFMNSTQEGVADPDRRSITDSRATSPERDEAEVVSGEVAGGGYAAPPAVPTLARVRPPEDVKYLGLSVTEPFRAPRRLGP